MERPTLPARLVAAFDKVKIKGIAKKILLNNTFVTSRRLSGEAHGASGALVAAFNKVEIKVIAEKVLSNHTFITSKSNQW